MPPSSSIPLDGQDHADACDDGERSSSSRTRASPRVSSCAPSSRQPPSADDQDHRGATSLGASGADRSSPSACCLKHFPSTTGSRNSLPAERGPGLRSRGFVVSASSPP